MRGTTLDRATFPVALFSALALAATGVAASVTTVTTHSTNHGKVLANSGGRSLYVFARDRRGSRGRAPQITCYGRCARVWRPLLLSAGAKPAAVHGSGVNQRLLGRARRRSGALQITYNGWPLYLYVRDTKPGQTHGEGANQFGARWYLLNTRGQELKPRTGCPPGYQWTPSGCLPQTY